MENPGLQIRHLGTRYGRRGALRDVSLDLRRGEIVGLLGPNGAGKSTTIGMLSGFLTPTSGEILWEGRSIFADLAGWRRQIGVVLEDLALFDYLTVGEHLRLVGRLAGLGPGETGKRAAELLDFLQLQDHEETIAAEASHGTRKKLALALGLLHSPRVLLLDEATNGIDAVTVSRVKTLLRKLAERGVTILMSSHVLDALEAVVHRCVILDRGAVCLDRTLEELRGSGRSLEEVYTSTILGTARAESELSWVQ